MQLHQSLYRNDFNAKVIVVTFAPPENVRRWQQYALFSEAPPELFAHTRFAANPTLSAYHAYGLGRNSVLRVYRPAILLHYAGLYLRGKGLPRVSQDPLQRGGDFVIRDGKILYSHVGRDQSDRPPVAQISALLRGNP